MTQIRDRLAALHIDIDKTVADRHLAAIATELWEPTRPTRHRKSRRIKLGALVAAAVLTLLPAAAIASERAVPGDLLYPIKLATERILLLVDPNVEAEHRIEELEILVDRAVPFDEISDRLVDADQSVRDRDVPDDLLDRLRVARDRVATEYERPDNATPLDEGCDEPVGSDRPGDDVRSGQTRPTTTTTPTTTTLPATDRQPPPESSTTEPPQNDRAGSDATTTTAPARDQGYPPRDG